MTHRLPPGIAWPLAVFLVLAAFAAAQTGIAWAAVTIMNTNFQRTDEIIEPRPPLAAEQSGSDESLVSWDSLGSLGRAFVAAGPSAQDVSRFTGRQAKQPIRAYAGRKSAPSLHEAAVLAARELERTGGFSRAVLCVVVTTGRGLVDENFIEPLEYMYDGDTAVVATQYSYQASWLSFLTGRSDVRAAARELFEEVHVRWARLPAASRPLLVVFGESLGAYGADAPCPADFHEIHGGFGGSALGHQRSRHRAVGHVLGLADGLAARTGFPPRSGVPRRKPPR